MSQNTKSPAVLRCGDLQVPFTRQWLDQPTLSTLGLCSRSANLLLELLRGQRSVRSAVLTRVAGGVSVRLVVRFQINGERLEQRYEGLVSNLATELGQPEHLCKQPTWREKRARRAAKH